MTTKIERFNLELDQLLKNQPANAQQSDPLLWAASVLNALDFETESRPPADLRSRWAAHTRGWSSKTPACRWLSPRTAWVTALAITLLLILAFRQPVFAAVGRLFGYIYLQDLGFLPASSTLVLQQPVLQEHEGRTLTAQRGIATPADTILYLEYNDTASGPVGAFLETPEGVEIPLSGWEFNANTPASHGLRLIFPALPVGLTRTTLVLSSGWHLPLTWVSAAQSGLPDVQVVPFPQSPNQATKLPELCAEKNSLKVCVRASATSTENTSVLIEAQSTIPELLAGGWPGLVRHTDTEPVYLRDDQSHIFPLIRAQAETLTFPPLPAGHKVTLVIPAMFASVDIPDQNIVVDVGNNPQPNTSIQIDATIKVLGALVHFSKASLVGDGVNNLRLTLDADPVAAVNGFMPAALEMGKPERVDDLYGGGMLDGGKDLFVELIRQNGKITGVLSLPVVSASVIVQGPFELNFTLSDAQFQTPSASVADPGSFAPAATATPIALDAYSFSGQILAPGDLLFSALEDANTQIYAFNPGIMDGQPHLVMTLPGAVLQMHLHPDLQGLDYLAGIQITRDGFVYIDHISLYTLRFGDSAPRLLYSFSPNFQNLVGTITEGDWSFDGRYAVFRTLPETPGQSPFEFIWLDLTCRTGEKCIPHQIKHSKTLDLEKARFAPADYRILFSGTDNSNTGEDALFLVNLNPASLENEVISLNANSVSLKEKLSGPPAWSSDSRVFALCNNIQDPSLLAFCFFDPQTLQIEKSAPVAEHVFDYQLAGSGKHIMGVVINHNAPGKGVMELHVFDLNGKAGPVLAADQGFTSEVISPGVQYIAFIPEAGDRVQIIDLNSGKTSQVYSSANPHTFNWLGWLP